MQIIPTVTAETIADFQSSYDRVRFAQTIHLDMTDGLMTPAKLIIDPNWLDPYVNHHIHVMSQVPELDLEAVMKLNPELIILHIEARSNLLECISRIKSRLIKVGIAILPETHDYTKIESIGSQIDQILIFGGHLGYQGGQARLECLNKIPRLRQICPNAEFAWDGGINIANIAMLKSAGIRVFNCGSAISSAADPQQSYFQLDAIIQGR